MSLSIFEMSFVKYIARWRGIFDKRRRGDTFDTQNLEGDLEPGPGFDSKVFGIWGEPWHQVSWK